MSAHSELQVFSELPNATKVDTMPSRGVDLDIYEMETPNGLVVASFMPGDLLQTGSHRNDYRVTSTYYEDYTSDLTRRVDRMLGFASGLVIVDGVMGALATTPRADYANTVIEKHFTDENGLAGGIREFLEQYDVHGLGGNQTEAETWASAQALGSVIIAKPDYVQEQEGEDPIGLFGHDITDHGPGYLMFIDFIIAETRRSIDQIEDLGRFLPNVSNDVEWTIAKQIAQNLDGLSNTLRMHRWSDDVSRDAKRRIFSITNLRKFVKEHRLGGQTMLSDYSDVPAERKVQHKRVDDISAGLQARSDNIVKLAVSGAVEEPFPWLNAA